ncbi:MAG TPA: rhomboid family intramembrane serine protease [Candidatus Onthousia faecavium]|nr:rhomboid family intramembrane serine protease [Candidatus Onthousia faecavium]
MEEHIIDMNEKNTLAMKLLHYFITEKNYTPIILQGAEDEIWLENLDEDYKIVRIVIKYIHNNEQYKFDVFKTNRILKKIKRKTLSFKLNTLSIFLDLGGNVSLDEFKNDNVTAVEIKEDEDIKKNKLLKSIFPDLAKKIRFSEEGVALFVKVTNDINKHNQEDHKKAVDVFKPKKPIVTYTLIIINLLAFFIPLLIGNSEYVYNHFASFGPFIKMGEYYRLLTATFLHANIAHLLFNMYALWIVGMQLESFIGKTRFLIVYLFSAIAGSLLSVIVTFNAVSVGASGAIFGLLGALLYFGYHYRVYLSSVIKSQIIPVIIINLVLGFILPGVDNAAHIGGLIGGFLMMIGVGVKYKSSRFEQINGVIVSLIYLAFLIYMAFIF